MSPHTEAQQTRFDYLLYMLRFFGLKNTEYEEKASSGHACLFHHAKLNQIRLSMYFEVI